MEREEANEPEMLPAGRRWRVPNVTENPREKSVREGDVGTKHQPKTKFNYKNQI